MSLNCRSDLSFVCDGGGIAGGRGGIDGMFP